MTSQRHFLFFPEDLSLYNWSLSAVLAAPTPAAAAGPEEETRGRAEEAGLDGRDDVLGQLVDVLGPDPIENTISLSFSLRFLFESVTWVNYRVTLVVSDKVGLTWIWDVPPSCLGRR